MDRWLNKIHCGDCIEVMQQMPENCVDAIVTDPPYGLSFMGKDWDTYGRTRDYKQRDPDKARVEGLLPGYGRGGMNDSVVKYRLRAGQEFYEASFLWAVEALRVAKPGAHILAFGGTRTFHRLACAIEDAGWEIRDCVMWVYGSGFPKSLDVSKAIDREAGAEREVVSTVRVKGGGTEHINRTNATVHDYRPDGYQKGENVLDVTIPATEAAHQWEGWGTALKPAYEPIIVARKPLEGTVATNVQKWGCGGINVDGCRVEWDEKSLENDTKRRASPRTDVTGGNFHSGAGQAQGYIGEMESPKGRWPANFIHDGSEEVVGLFPDRKGLSGGGAIDNTKTGNETIPQFNRKPSAQFIRGDSGSAARFFYTAKASPAERGKDNKHPTVKPLALMQYLCRLVTPPNGIILDPFAGSGTTCVAAKKEFFQWIGIEQDTDSVATGEKRIPKHVQRRLF